MSKWQNKYKFNELLVKTLSNFYEINAKLLSKLYQFVTIIQMIYQYDIDFSKSLSSNSCIFCERINDKTKFYRKSIKSKRHVDDLIHDNLMNFFSKKTKWCLLNNNLNKWFHSNVSCKHFVRQNIFRNFDFFQKVFEYHWTRLLSLHSSTNWQRRWIFWKYFCDLSKETRHLNRIFYCWQFSNERMYWTF